MQTLAVTEQWKYSWVVRFFSYYFFTSNCFDTSPVWKSDLQKNLWWVSVQPCSESS